MGPAAALGIGAAVQGIGGLFGASKQADAAKQAALLQQQSGDKALAFNQGMYGQAQQNYSPYLQAGQSATSGLSSFLSNNATPDQMPAFAAPTSDQVRGDEGYQFRLAEGLKAQQAGQGRAGTLLSGAGLKQLGNYAQGEASTEYGNAYQRALSGYGANLQAFGANQNAKQNTFGNLFSTAGLGFTAASGLSGLGAQYANQYGNIVTGQGNAAAAGQIGSANAWGQGISGFGSAINGGIGSYYALQNGQGRSMPSGGQNIYGYGPSGGYAPLPSGGTQDWNFGGG